MFTWQVDTITRGGHDSGGTEMASLTRQTQVLQDLRSSNDAANSQDCCVVSDEALRPQVEINSKCSKNVCVEKISTAFIY